MLAVFLSSCSSDLICAEWVRKLARRSLDFPNQCLTDPVLAWGVSITPLLTLHCTDLRGGGRILADGGSCCQVLTTGLVAVDAQLRFKNLPLWKSNSSLVTVRDGMGRKPAPLFDEVSAAVSTSGAEMQLGCDDISVVMLASKERHAAGMQDVARDRRRAAMGIHCPMPEREMRGLVRQRWRRVLEIQKQLCSADYALFLLAGRYRMDLQVASEAGSRHHARKAAFGSQARLPFSGSAKLSVHPLLQHAQHMRNFKQQTYVAPAEMPSNPDTHSSHEPVSAIGVPLNPPASHVLPVTQATSSPHRRDVSGQAPEAATSSNLGRDAISGLIAAVGAYRHTRSISMASQPTGHISSPSVVAPTPGGPGGVRMLQKAGSLIRHRRAMSMMHTLLDFSPAAFLNPAPASSLQLGPASDLGQPQTSVNGDFLKSQHNFEAVADIQNGLLPQETGAVSVSKLFRQRSMSTSPLIQSPSSGAQHGQRSASLPRSLLNLNVIKQSMLSRTTTMDERSGRPLPRQVFAVMDLVRDEAVLLSFVEVSQ